MPRVDTQFQKLPEWTSTQNSFYTTAANRMSRHVFRDAITAEDVDELIRRNKEE